MTNYMFDVKVFDEVLSEYLPEIGKSVGDNKYFVIQEQYEKIAAGDRTIFTVVPGNIIDTQAREIMTDLLNGVKPQDPNNNLNALLIELCKARQYTLVAGERHIAELIWKYGGSVKSLREYLKAINSDRYSAIEP